MIPIQLDTGRTNPRITRDARLSQAQRDAIRVVASNDFTAKVVGLDSKLRPVVQAFMAGPNKTTRFSLLRNGEAAPVELPIREEWS